MGFQPGTSRAHAKTPTIHYCSRGWSSRIPYYFPINPSHTLVVYPLQPRYQGRDHVEPFFNGKRTSIDAHIHTQQYESPWQGPTTLSPESVNYISGMLLQCKTCDDETVHINKKKRILRAWHWIFTSARSASPMLPNVITVISSWHTQG